MENPLRRTQSLTRQKWNTGQRRESGLSKSSRSGAAFSRHLSSHDRARSFMSGELTTGGRPRSFLSGELPLVRPPAPVSPPKVSAPATTAMRDAATNTDDVSSIVDATSVEAESVKCESLRSRSGKEKAMTEEQLVLDTSELFLKREVEVGDDVRSSAGPLQRCSSMGASSVTSVQTDREGSHNRLLSKGGESSSFRGKQLSSSLNSDGSSFGRETVLTSFRKEAGSRRKERKASKSFQDGEISSIASESARGSPCSIHYNQALFSAKLTPSRQHGTWSSSPSSPDVDFRRSSVPFQWEEAPGKAKTIAAAAEMALARKLVRDESLRRLHGASPRSSVDSQGSFRLEKKISHGSSKVLFTEPSIVLALPPSQKASQELVASRKDMHSSQLIEELKAAVVRKQAGDNSSTVKEEIEDDARSVISECGGGEQAHIDLVAPAASKILNRENDRPVLTPVKTPLAAVPFKWEEAPGKPKDSVGGPLDDEPVSLSLPPRLLVGCHKPSKEQQAKILQTYSCNLMDMYLTASGNPTPLSRSRDGTPTNRDRTPTRRDRTPSRRDRTPTKRDSTPGKRDVTPTKRDSTPTRGSFSSRVLPKSGPIAFPTVPSQENIREHFSGPLRSNTNPNYLNVVPRSVSQEFARVTQESALAVLAQDIHRPSKQSSDAGSGFLDSRLSSRIGSQELQVVRCESAAEIPGNRRVSTDHGAPCREPGNEHESRGSVKVASAVDPLSPTSVLAGPDAASCQRSSSNLSSVYPESLHSNHLESISDHSKTESCASLESFVDEAYNIPPWSGTLNMEPSPICDLGPIDTPTEVSQGKSIEGMKAIFKFCRKARKWNKPKNTLGKNSAEPDMWAPTLATYFPKLELGGTILNKVGSQVFPESKEGKSVSRSEHLTVPCSPLKFVPRSGDLTATPDHVLGSRKLSGNVTPVQAITTCRSPAYRVMATDECFSVFSLSKVWSGTKARQAKWGRKMRRSSRLMTAIFGALKRSMSLKCGRQTLPNIPSARNLLGREVDGSKEHKAQSRHGSVHSLSANHQFHRPL